jgi:AcrR family transcriptional regulator
MAKNADDMASRLQHAALDLFREQGYDRTTAAGIAARAGVTERTFFRYFADKREVLFGGEAVLRSALLRSINEAPEQLGPLETLFRAFQSVRTLLENNRPFSVPRQEIISATPALQEREQAKLAALADALAIALKARGATELQSVLAARTGMAAFALATVAWLEHPQTGLAERLDLILLELKMLFAAVSPADE